MRGGSAAITVRIEFRFVTCNETKLYVDSVRPMAEGNLNRFCQARPQAVPLGRHRRWREQSGVITDTPEFVQSVAEQGVLSPITATRRKDGTLRIHDGQRRILAARESGLAFVPVMVTEESSDDRQAQIRCVTGQLHANDQRAITDRHRVGAVTELLDLGLDVEQIAKATKLGPKFTRAAAKAGRSANVGRHLDELRLNLDDAAARRTRSRRGSIPLRHRSRRSDPRQPLQHLPQPEVLLLARVLTASEARPTGNQDAKDYWRYAKKSYRGLDGIDTYLTFLADAGHTLSAVEQAAIGNITIDAAHNMLDED